MKKLSINLKGSWSSKMGTIPSKVDFGSSIFREMKSFMVSFRIPDVTGTYIDIY